MRMMNDELAYMTWIEIVPDEATFEDFKDIAEDDEAFEEVLNEFQRLFALYKYAEQAVNTYRLLARPGEFSDYSGFNLGVDFLSLLWYSIITERRQKNDSKRID